MPQTDDNSRIAQMAESAIAKFAVRVLVPIIVLITLPLLTVIYGGIRGDVSAVRMKTDQQDERMQTLERGMDRITTTIDAGLMWRVGELERRFALMEHRMDARQRAASGGADYPPGAVRAP